MCAPISAKWLGVCGLRCAYLAKRGEHASASKLRCSAAALAGNPEISAREWWQFHSGAAASLNLSHEPGLIEFPVFVDELKNMAGHRRIRSCRRSCPAGIPL